MPIAARSLSICAVAPIVKVGNHSVRRTRLMSSNVLHFKNREGFAPVLEKTDEGTLIALLRESDIRCALDLLNKHGGTLDADEYAAFTDSLAKPEDPESQARVAAFKRACSMHLSEGQIGLQVEFPFQLQRRSPVDCLPWPLVYKTAYPKQMALRLATALGLPDVTALHLEEYMEPVEHRVCVPQMGGSTLYSDIQERAVYVRASLGDWSLSRHLEIASRKLTGIISVPYTDETRLFEVQRRVLLGELVITSKSVQDLMAGQIAYTWLKLVAEGEKAVKTLHLPYGFTYETEKSIIDAMTSSAILGVAEVAADELGIDPAKLEFELLVKGKPPDVEDALGPNYNDISLRMQRAGTASSITMDWYDYMLDKPTSEFLDRIVKTIKHITGGADIRVASGCQTWTLSSPKH